MKIFILVCGWLEGVDISKINLDLSISSFLMDENNGYKSAYR